jgi:MFS family permease
MNQHQILTLNDLAHMSLKEVYICESVVVVLIIVFEVPTGSIADMLGRKKTICIGQCFLFLSALTFAFMHNPFMGWMANILWAIGFSFQSGADSSLLYETLKEGGMEHMNKQIKGRNFGSRLLLVAFCSLLSGYLADIHLRLPLLVGIPFLIIPLIVSFFFIEPRHEYSAAHAYTMSGQIDLIKKAFGIVFRSKALRWIIGFTALIGVSSKLWFFTYNPYFKIVGLDVKYVGVIFFFLNVTAWFTSRYAKEIEDYLQEKNSIVLMIVLIGVPLILMGMFPTWMGACLVLLPNLTRGIIVPFVDDYTNKHLSSESRSTGLSIRSCITSTIQVFAMWGFGVLVESAGVCTSQIILGIVVLIVGAMCFAQYRNIK